MSNDNTDLPLAEIRNTPSTVSMRPNTARPLILAEVLTIEAQQRDLLGKYVKHHMIEGSDFGVIPGTQKPTLLKAGAEKLVDLFRCTPVYEIVERIEDWDRPLFHYLFRVRIESRESGVIVAEGYGSANSRESRYRWRNGERKCPNCGKPTIIKGKDEYGGGWVCFKRKGGCNAKFPDGDQSIEGQQVGRVENPDICDQANTILKMAKKRALVDASIALARCSDLFTQDIEDAGGSGDDYAPPVDPQPRPATPTLHALPPRPARESGIEDGITDKTQAGIEAALRILKREWSAETVALAMRAVGHTLPDDISLAMLTEAEGLRLLEVLNARLKKVSEQGKGGAA